MELVNSGKNINKNIQCSLKCLYDFSRKFIRNNIIFVLISIFTFVLAYGFYATKYTVNVDQLVSEYYNGEALITVGRWCAPLIHFFTNWMEYSPFWHTCMMCFMFFVSGLCWIYLFYLVSNGNIKDKHLYVFFLLYPICPIISEQLTFPILNITLAYILTPISLILLLSLFFENCFEIKKIIIAFALMLASIDMYESFASVFLTGLFMIVIVYYIYNSSKLKYKDLFFICLKTGVFLILVIVVDFFISKLVCYIFSDSFSFLNPNNTTIYWLKYGNIFDCIIYLLSDLFAHYFVYATSDISMFLFISTVALSIIISTVYSIKKRSYLPIVLILCLIISTISLGIVICNAPLNRMEQSIPLFIAFVFMLLSMCFNKKKIISLILTICIVFIVQLDTQTINNVSVKNYEIYEYCYSEMRDIGNELEKYSTDSKAVIFVQNDDADIIPATLVSYEFSEHPLISFYQKNMCRLYDKILPEKFWEIVSYTQWYNGTVHNCKELIRSMKLSSTVYSNNILVRLYFSEFGIAEGYRAMKRLGYDLIPCTEEQYEEAKNYLQPDDNFKKFCITETDEMIIVQLMSCQN